MSFERCVSGSGLSGSGPISAQLEERFLLAPEAPLADVLNLRRQQSARPHLLWPHQPHLFKELASGTPLARALAIYMAVFWGGRLALQAGFDVKPHLTRWWLVVGYHLLTGLFLYFLAAIG